jgi:hypothetical protein
MSDKVRHRSTRSWAVIVGLVALYTVSSVILTSVALAFGPPQIRRPYIKPPPKPSIPPHPQPEQRSEMLRRFKQSQPTDSDTTYKRRSEPDLGVPGSRTPLEEQRAKIQPGSGPSSFPSLYKEPSPLETMVRDYRAQGLARSLKEAGYDPNPFELWVARTFEDLPRWDK